MRLIIAALFLLIISYFIIDRELYFYGENHFGIYHGLPMKITPENWGYDKGNLGFVLLDEADITLIAKGSKFFSSDVIVNEILMYGFNASILLAKVNDINGNNFLVSCLKNNELKTGMSVTVKPVSSEIHYDGIKWVNIKENERYAKTLKLIQNYIFFAFIISMMVLVYRVIKIRLRLSSK